MAVRRRDERRKRLWQLADLLLCGVVSALFAVACLHLTDNSKPAPAAAPANDDDVELQPVTMTCALAKAVASSTNEELLFLEQRIKLFSTDFNGAPATTSETDPMLVVLGHQWRALDELKTLLNGWTKSQACALEDL